MTRFQLSVFAAGRYYFAATGPGWSGCPDSQPDIRLRHAESFRAAWTCAASERVMTLWSRSIDLFWSCSFSTCFGINECSQSLLAITCSALTRLLGPPIVSLQRKRPDVITFRIRRSCAMAGEQTLTWAGRDRCTLAQHTSQAQLQTSLKRVGLQWNAMGVCNIGISAVEFLPVQVLTADFQGCVTNPKSQW